MIREDSTAWNAHQVIVQPYSQEREFDRAIAAQAARRRAMRDTTPGFPSATILARQGRREEALLALDELVRRAGGSDNNYDIGLAYGALGRKDEAFAWLEKNMQARKETVIWLKVDPDADPLRSDPRFHALLRRLGLEP